jgi:hypothetical protein
MIDKSRQDACFVKVLAGGQCLPNWHELSSTDILRYILGTISRGWNKLVIAILYLTTFDILENSTLNIN